MSYVEKQVRSIALSSSRFPRGGSWASSATPAGSQPFLYFPQESSSRSEIPLVKNNGLQNKQQIYWIQIKTRTIELHLQWSAPQLLDDMLPNK